MGTDYIDLLTKFPFENVLALLLLTALRIVPIIILAPFWGGRLLPSAAKIGFGIFISLVLFPFLAPLSLEGLTSGFPLIPLCLKEVMLGFLIGFLCTIPFNIATSTGSVIDHQRGSASLMVTDPALTTQTSPIGMFLNEMMLVSFFLIGGADLFFQTLIASFQHIPPQAFISPASFSPNVFWKTMIDLMNILFTLTVRFASPPLLAMLMADIFLGIANRLAPQVQIAFLGMPLKSLLGLIILFVGFHFITMHMDRQMLFWFKKLYTFFSIFPTVAPS